MPLPRWLNFLSFQSGWMKKNFPDHVKNTYGRRISPPLLHYSNVFVWTHARDLRDSFVLQLRDYLRCFQEFALVHVRKRKALHQRSELMQPTSNPAWDCRACVTRKRFFIEKCGR